MSAARFTPGARPRAAKHTRTQLRAAARAIAWIGAIALVAAGCMHASGAKDPTRRHDALTADSVTVAMWHMDETGGTEVVDAGPFRLDGTAGLETRTDFGRFQGARTFTPHLDSFVLVAHDPLLDLARAITVEAWIRLDQLSDYEAAPLAIRWTPVSHEQSWFFGLVGHRRGPPAVTYPSPGYLNGIVAGGRAGQLVFAFQPDDATPPRSFFSGRTIEPGRWTHVAASYDGAVVRLFVNGLLDGQFATSGGMRASLAPLMVGNFFDPRWLGDFGGDLRIEQALDGRAYYAFVGSIDELRISNVARTEFPQSNW